MSIANHHNHIKTKKQTKETRNALYQNLSVKSETLRLAFMDYAKELSMVKESIHRGKSIT
jgi:hypothetical protein